MRVPTVLLADDHGLFAEGLAHLLSGQFDVAGIATDGGQLVEMTTRLHPDLLVIDLAMPNCGGLEALRRLRAAHLQTRVVILTMHADARLASEALRTGASGFVLKNATGEELCAALLEVLQGRTYLPPQLIGEVLSLITEPTAPADVHLTSRQRQVLELVVEGRRMKEVAVALNLSPRTVETGEIRNDAGAWRALDRRAREVRDSAAAGRGRRIHAVEIAPLSAVTARIGARLALYFSRHAEAALRERERELREALARNHELAGRLISAQEAERIRLARELHDHVCQAVASVGVELSRLRRHKGVTEPDVREQLADLQRQVAKLAEDIRQIAHDLHPSVLQHIGLSSAIETHAAEVERYYDVQVAVDVGNAAARFDNATALGLYRIVQEAVRNAARHGEARHIAIRVASDPALTVLSIEDDGVGFDVAAARARRTGLGLISIEERALALGGGVLIRSRPGDGTTSPALVRRALAAGVLGYVLKVSAGEDLLPAVRAALRGEQFVSEMPAPRSNRANP